MTNPTSLRHGRIYPVRGGRVAVAFLSNPQADGEPLRVELATHPDGGGEESHTVHVGDRFSIGTAAWILERVDNVGTYDYVVQIRPAD